MDIFPVIQTYFKINNVKLEYDSIGPFFNQGIAFPKFVALSFGLETLPGLNKNPSSWYQKRANNDLAIKYLSEHNAFFKKFVPNFETDKNKQTILHDILIKQTYPMNQSAILDTINLILRSLAIQYKSYEEIINITSLQLLIYVLTDYKMQLITDINDETIKNYFEKAKVPLITNFLDKEIFGIQIQILFNTFSDKINQIKSSEANPVQNDSVTEEKLASLNKLFEKDELFESENNLNEDESDFIEEDDEDEIEDEKMEEEDDDDIENANKLKIGEDEKLEDEALLKTINCLSKSQFGDEYPAFSKFKQTLLNDFIPRFVMKILNITSIEKVQLSKEKRSNILTKQDIKNVYSVIKFLSTKEKTFRVLMFDFYTPFERETSTKLFFKNFLNFFFITQSREEMIERLNIFIGDCDNNHQNTFNAKIPHYKLLIQAMRFISRRPDDMVTGLLQMYQKVFEFFSVPIVFHNDQWNTFDNDDVLPDSYFYQIKLLFNEWDSNKTTFPIIELFLKSNYKFQNVKVPRLDILKSSIKAKIVTPESNTEDIQENKTRKIEKKEENLNSKENLEIKKNKTLRYFKERQKRLNNNNVNDDFFRLQKTGKFNLKIEMSKDAILFWDKTSEVYIFDNGIIHENVNEKNKGISFQSIGTNTSSEKQFPPQPTLNNQINNEIPDGNNQREFLIKMLNTHTKSEHELYKIFVYDETDKTWKFDSQSFQNFTKNKRLNSNNMKTPLVFMVNSDEQNIIDFNSHFIHGLYPNLEKEEQICVYALCDKTLTMLSMKNDFSDQIKASTKPIFLQIHVPKKKENIPRIQSVLSQMICYLTSISSVSIMIMKDHVSQEQISYYQKILHISKLADKSIDKNENENTNNNENLNEENEGENENEVNGFIYKKIKSIYLINIPKINYNEETAVNYHNHSAYSGCIDYKNDNELLLIDVNNVETYDHFFDTLSRYILSNNMNFTEVEQDFKSFYGFEMGLKYITMRLSPDWKSLIKSAIMTRYLTFVSQSESKSLENLANALTDIYNEIIFFTPRFDFEFVKEYQSIILSMRKNTSQMNRKDIAKELAISADYDISFIFGSLENDDIYTDEQLNNFRRNHEVFLKKEYYDIVKLSSIESMFDLVFEDNFDLIWLQIDNDREKLNKKFKILIDNIQKMRTVSECTAQESAKKNTNYMLKETENLREIKVAVQVKKDLTSIIEQDF